MNIIITGASRGIGWELTQLFAKSKENKVFIISRNLEKLTALSALCKEKFHNNQVIPIALDIAALDTIESQIASISKITDRIDILINNAGYLIAKPFESLSISEVDTMYRVNVTGPFELIKNLLPKLKKSTHPHIVNISSMGGFQGSVKFPGLTAYASSKAAIAGLTECLAEELKETPIKVNCLALGAVATEMLAEAFPGYEAPTTASEMANYIYHFAINGHNMFNGKILPVSKTTP